MSWGEVRGIRMGFKEVSIRNAGREQGRRKVFVMWSYFVCSFQKKNMKNPLKTHLKTPRNPPGGKGGLSP